MQRLTFIGNCQILALLNIYDRFVGQSRGDVLHYVASYIDLNDEGRRAIEQADIIVEQLMEFKQKVDSGGLAGGARRVLVPLASGGFYWPFAGQPHPRNPAPWFLEPGPFDAEYADSYLNRLIGQKLDPDEAVERYLKLDVNSVMDLDRFFDLILERQRQRDEITGFDLATIIQANFRYELLFRTPFHPELRIARYMAAELFRRLGIGEDAIERMQRYLTIPPFPERALPIHPSVIRHFGLTCVGPNHRYKNPFQGDLTFEEFARCYVRCEWNQEVEEGIALVGAGKHQAGVEKLERGVARFPNSYRGLEVLARQLQLRGRIADAIALARRALELDPQRSKLHYRLGDLLRQLGDITGALAEFDRARQLDPSDQQTLAMLTALLAEQERIDEAVEVAREAVLLMPRNAELHFRLSGLLKRSGALLEAEEACRKAVELDPSKELYCTELSAVVDQRHSTAKSEQSLRQAVAADPASVRIRVALCRHLIAQRRSDEASTLAQEGLNQASLTADAAGALGSLLRGLGDLEAAERACRLAVEHEPSSPGRHTALSQVLREREKWDEAMVTIRQARGLAPADPEIAAAYAELLHRQGHTTEAETILEAVVAFAPDNAPAHALLGLVRAQQGKSQEAFDATQRAVELAPRNPQYLVQLANLQRKRGELAKAEQVLRTTMNTNPTYAEGYAALARLLIDQDRRTEAVVPARRAAELDPNNRHHLGLLGNLLWQVGELAEAEQALRGAIRLDPSNADLRATLSHLLARVARWDEAIAFAHDALALDPRNSYLNGHLGALLRERIRDNQATAESLLRRAIELDRANANAYGQLAHLLLSLGRVREAIRAAQKAAELEPHNPHHQALLKLLLDSDDPAGAVSTAAPGHRACPP